MMTSTIYEGLMKKKRDTKPPRYARTPEPKMLDPPHAPRTIIAMHGRMLGTVVVKGPGTKGQGFPAGRGKPLPESKRKASKGRVTFKEPPVSPEEVHIVRPRRGSAPPLEVLATPPSIPSQCWSGHDVAMLLSMPFCEVLDAYPLFARALETEPEITRKGLSIDWLSPIKPPRLFNTISSCIDQGMFGESTAPNTYRVPFSPVVSVASPPLDASAAEFYPRSLVSPPSKATPTPPSKSKLDPHAPEFTPPSVMKAKSPLPFAEDLLLPAGPATFIAHSKKKDKPKQKPFSGESFDLYSTADSSSGKK